MSAQPEPTPEEIASIKERIFSTPLPLPIRFQLAPVQLSDTQNGVAVAIETPAGSFRVIWESEFCEHFASQLRKTARSSSSGIILPEQPGFVVPG